ncbi:cytochrome d ubiquinol oxidase subunit II [Candidatus Bodocaedibacter vickermanii]|uniref:Cytochrome bd-I ubiquinol oxidase subunit 2 n=1 Tax=Candidatus Bodocaedibacter vickermanii TaxID=2741701 RepID=A0A7L9RUQ5_9PROT|nr:Cytochrome bd-I ubiquinol oxidase subunit 2 [Candidatus Paracaedibacteraceae bacterium 'Lake Konstanz']
MDYAIAWSILIPVALFIYMALDGFDLGIGILFPLGSDSRARENMMNSIAPIWDTNETWLVLAASGLYGIFPKAYVFIFNALYIPLIAMLICLIFRGVSFEFRFKSPERFKWIWSTFFCLGSFGMSVFQGIVFGQLIQGFQTIDSQFNNDYWAWLNIFNVAVAGLVVLFYAFMGANFLIYRLKETERLRFVCVSKWLLGVTVLYFISIVVVFGSGVHSADAASFPSGKYLAQRFQAFYSAYIGLFAIIGLIVVKLYRSLAEKAQCDFAPFLYGVALLAAVFGGVVFLGWPYIVPGALTIWQASSLPETQKLMFIGASIFLPLILGYSMYNFYVFRGKVADQKFYH